MTRLLPGAHVNDSPAVDDTITADRWAAWLRVEADRLTSVPTPGHVLRYALGITAAPPWRFWWDRAHPGGLLTHRADVVPVHGGGETLLSACGYSQPWPGYGVGVAPVGNVPVRDARRTYCLHCTSTVPGLWPAPEDRRPVTPRT